MLKNPLNILQIFKCEVALNFPNFQATRFSQKGQSNKIWNDLTQYKTGPGPFTFEPYFYICVSHL